MVSSYLWMCACMLFDLVPIPSVQPFEKLTKPRTDSTSTCQNILNLLIPTTIFTNQIPPCFSSTFYLKAQPPQQKESYINLTWAETPIFSALWQALFNSGKVTEPLRSLSKA